MRLFIRKLSRTVSQIGVILTCYLKYYNLATNRLKELVSDINNIASGAPSSKEERQQKKKGSYRK